QYQSVATSLYKLRPVQFGYIIFECAIYFYFRNTKVHPHTSGSNTIDEIVAAGKPCIHKRLLFPARWKASIVPERHSFIARKIPGNDIIDRSGSIGNVRFAARLGQGRIAGISEKNSFVFSYELKQLSLSFFHSF